VKALKSSTRRFVICLVSMILIGCASNGCTIVPPSSGSGSLLATATPAPSSTLQISGTKQKIAFTYLHNGKFDIYVMEVDGRDQKDLTGDVAFSMHPVWSPNGERIAFSSAQGGPPQIFVMNADGSGRKQLTHDQSATGAASPTWSPDGMQIAYIAHPGTPFAEVYIMNVDGSQQRRLTTNQDEERDLAWSPKGDAFAVSVNMLTASGTYFPEQIYRMNLNGSFGDGFSTLPYTGQPAWSPDGRFIAFSSSRDGGICVARTDGSNQRCLLQSVEASPVSNHVFNVDPSWSPDGNYIVFSSNRDGHYNIYEMKPSGSDLVRLTNLPGDERSPTWTAGP
jgi:Tol biopolymer transport system component